MDNVVILVEKEELEELCGNPISDETWLEIKSKIMRDKAIWHVVDEAIKEIVDSL